LINIKHYLIIALLSCFFI